MASWMVICEDQEDFEVATGLADRLAYASSRVPDWVRDDLDTFRQWMGANDESEKFTPWGKLKETAASQGSIRKHGYRRERFGSASIEVEKAIGLAAYRRPPPDGLLLIRDADKTDRLDRRKEYEKAIQEARNKDIGIAICFGIPHPELEAWLLNGFEPQNEEEQARLTKQKKTLGCDPRVASNTLKAGAQFAQGQPVKRNVKNIIDALTDKDAVTPEQNYARRADCYKTELTTLRTRGQASGLQRYLIEVEDHMLPSWSK